MRKLFLILLLGCFGPFTGQAQTISRKPITRTEFVRLMQTLAAGLNENNAYKAADCFALDALYTEPPNRKNFRGRHKIFDYFGGIKGRPTLMKMTWHHLAFDEQTQIGSGEFTLSSGNTIHGMVSVRIRDGLIGNWREYFYESPLDWNAFILQNPF
ncbi:nuclear transport factor 2 family protein [Larkinella soli]|uniref:nuclear transport factor 2 family protein n=1 Tax=Larkinella soli TaxID=1770527 RepID=UPI000FFC45DC|nr:nuclear transport factor 2 family protein [Larkinella soli]